MLKSCTGGFRAATALIPFLLSGIASPALERRATIKDNTISIEDADATFRIPREWVEWDTQFHNNIHLTANELLSIRDGSGEWDTEFAQVVNKVLPFENCIAHLGGEGWGQDAVSYGDLQMRVYLASFTPSDILDRAEDIGYREVMGLSKSRGLTRDRDGDWDHVNLHYDIWYSDYGSTAEIDFYARGSDERTLVFIFMYTDHSPAPKRQLRGILESMKSNSAGP